MLVMFPLNREKRGMFFLRALVLDVKSEYRQSEETIVSKGESEDWESSLFNESGGNWVSRDCIL